MTTLTIQTSCAPPAAPTGPSASRVPLTVFAVLWATATQVHQMSFHFWARTWQGWALVLCVSLVLLRPSSLPRFTFLIAASLVNLLKQLPFVPNHILFEGMINLTILTAILWNAWKHREQIRQAAPGLGFGQGLLVPVLVVAGYLGLLTQCASLPDACGFLTALMIFYFSRRTSPANVPASISEDIYRDVSGVLRWELAGMYFWAVIQKLNWDYFNPEVSCAVKLQSELETLLHLPASPQALLPLFSGGSLAIEAGIPILLLIRPLRPLGFLVALPFHFWLSLHPFAGIYSYSALVFAMLAAFLTPQQFQAIADSSRRLYAALVEKLSLPTSPLFPGGVAITVFYVLGITSSVMYSVRGHNQETFALVNQIGLAWFLVWASSVTCFYLAAWRLAPSGSLFAFRLSPAALGLLLVIVNGLNPWVGLKTQTSFAMFSNLRTEFAPNHMFLSRIDLFPYQRDMIEILDSQPDLLSRDASPRSIERFANPGRIMPFFELRRLLSRIDGDVRVVISRNGVTETIERSGDRIMHAEAFQPPTLLESKYLWFRRHNDWQGPMPCTH